jgi:hypothetical protein
VKDLPLFLVDRSGPTRLFYSVDFSDKVQADAPVVINGRTLRFGDVFAPIVRRTGKHDGNGTVFARGLALPPQIINHQLFDCLASYLVPAKTN